MNKEDRAGKSEMNAQSSKPSRGFSSLAYPCPKMDTKLHTLLFHWPGSELAEINS